ncbi:hypothetical protein HMPREF0971_02233 [Segatella oris F0302]|uniref:Uncharacterized protein n=1 Tax=Segatella oris F0302 TaxID=649760 RepID=D1QTA5_9BACT|nr:hypothetical protein HMPREF0971_02233 [Segatella oris F0302]
MPQNDFPTKRQGGGKSLLLEKMLQKRFFNPLEAERQMLQLNSHE